VISKKTKLEKIVRMIEDQLLDDRGILQELYNDLKQKCVNAQDYAVNGSNLAKYAELLIKQTGQMIDYVKISKPKDNDVGNLSEDEKDDLFEEIERDGSSEH